ncbi:MAG: SDR family oxidoreductase [Deltaproteobacteria bacterium]|nr:SDR family oxidoreductase [Deltaproteobacteria bacterium]
MERTIGLRIYQGAVAFITGAASGIGRALAEQLARRGSEVVLADLQNALAEEVAEQIRSAGGKATTAKLDVTDFSAVQKAIQETFVRTGRIDYLFNNAGIAVIGAIERYSIDDWNHILDVNLRGVINGVNAVYPLMKKQRFGHIVNTASLAGMIPIPGQAAYVTTKHAVFGLSTSLRVEAAFFGIRVSVLCPGFVLTPILRGGKFGKLYIDVSLEKIEQIVVKYQPMQPDVFARKALDAVAKNRTIIVEPRILRWVWRFNRLFPEYGIELAKFYLEKDMKEIGILAE